MVGREVCGNKLTLDQVTCDQIAISLLDAEAWQMFEQLRQKQDFHFSRVLRQTGNSRTGKTIEH